MTSLEQYVRHAELYGVECVHETAISYSGRKCQLGLLRVELVRIEAARKNGRYTVGKRRRRTPDESRHMIRLLREQGLVDQAIANRLGISLQRVRKVVQDHPKSAPQTRMVERQKWAKPNPWLDCRPRSLERPAAPRKRPPPDSTKTCKEVSIVPTTVTPAARA